MTVLVANTKRSAIAAQSVSERQVGYDSQPTIQQKLNA
jgi:hypothetical protein